ncbi:pentapeptide repeat-containing protein [Streptomyces massasporeus]|uniref:pentapeptide repeat-containing protein n=1 Tax=Streptomyces massasporeus TaxID=67324 RepID=UPI003F54135D
MPHPSPEPSLTPPGWPHCGHGTTPEDPAGCRGIHVTGHTACLAHLADADRDAYLAGLTPGTDIDHRGTPFTQELLDRLFDALRDPAAGAPRLGVADFESATFEGNVGFRSATFDRVSFKSAIFQGRAWFESAIFKGHADFGSTTFKGDAWFRSVIFRHYADFGRTTFEEFAWFGSAAFTLIASFDAATFKGDARFESTTFESDARFESTIFNRTAIFGRANFKSFAQFQAATFNLALFGSANFTHLAEFKSATFKGDADFHSVIFQRQASFPSATFHRGAMFKLATFGGKAAFRSATFKGNARFISAIFKDQASFRSATFEAKSSFANAAFGRDAQFVAAVFERSASLGPLVCAGRMVLSEAVFRDPVTLSFAARRLECRRTRWSSRAEVRLRYATVDFAHAVFEYPLTVAAESDPFMLPDGLPLAEHALAHAPDATVRMASLRGVDAAHLVLADLDLSRCLFTGTVHLDQVRLEGYCSFDEVPPGTHWRRWGPVRFTQRRTLAEEHHWRVRQLTAVRGWNVGVFAAGRVGPAQLAPVYRALRKAFEDSKNEPGAADFYYGEMEMRRHNRTGTTRAERGLLHGYWLLSGYGLRASRALGWLAAAMLVTIVLLMGVGLPQDSPKQEATGTLPPGGGKVTFEIDKADPQNPARDRFTGERFEKAVNVTLNSVVFRSSGQDLTTAGTYIEMASRVTEPVLLGLAVLAVRNRVKR